MRSKFKGLKNIVLILLLIGVGVFCFNTFYQPKAAEFELTESPLHIIEIRKVAEIASISFKDEVVVDSIVKYKSELEKVSGNIQKMTNMDGVKEAVIGSNVKSRLTLIIKGEAKIGFDLTDNNYRIEQNKDTVWFHFPKAKMLTINLNPSDMEVFQERGTWSDFGRRKVINKAKRIIEMDVKAAGLFLKAENAMKNVLLNLIPDKRKIYVYFE